MIHRPLLLIKAKEIQALYNYNRISIESQEYSKRIIVINLLKDKTHLPWPKWHHSKPDFYSW